DVALIGDLKEVLRLLLPLLGAGDFTIDPATGTITFGDGTQGQRPPFGNPGNEPSRQGGGSQGNVAPSSWLQEINKSKGTAAVRDIINLPDNGHLYAAHVIHDIWKEAREAGRLENTIIVT